MGVLQITVDTCAVVILNNAPGLARVVRISAANVGIVPIQGDGGAYTSWCVCAIHHDLHQSKGQGPVSDVSVG